MTFLIVSHILSFFVIVQAGIKVHLVYFFGRIARIFQQRRRDSPFSAQHRIINKARSQASITASEQRNVNTAAAGMTGLGADEFEMQLQQQQQPQQQQQQQRAPSFGQQLMTYQQFAAVAAAAAAGGAPFMGQQAAAAGQYP